MIKLFANNALIKGAVAAVALAASAVSFAADITGAGATFPFPIYAKWGVEYKKATNTGINYQSIGSGGGIRQITAKTVDFGATDAPMSAADLDRNGLAQFPAIIGGVVPVFNLKGVPRLNLTGQVIGDIYLGKIANWNHAEIAKLNPGVKLPDQLITPVYRSDGSGTTFLWTNFLSKKNAEFKSTISEGTAVKWPKGVGGKGNEGVSQYVQRLNGAFGYVEYAYAKQNKLSYAAVQNQTGKFVSPDDATFKAAAASAAWDKTPGMGVILTDQPGADSYPITGASFILVHKKSDKPQNVREVLKFFDWAFKNGDKMASDLEYVAMPEAVTKFIRSSVWNQVVDASGKPLL